MSKTRSQGFTLIELLVVIAIIGILSAVVLASLSTARSKGNDAAVQADLSTIQTQAEIYYGSAAGANSYGTQAWVSGAATSCVGGVFSDLNITAALKGADAANGTGNVDCVAASTYYVVAAALTTSTSYQCVDSTGKSETVAAALPTTAIAVCP